MTHTDAQQTATLHALPAFAEWARARGFRVGDWVEWRTYEALVLSNPSPNCGLRHCPITMDIQPVGIARVEAKPADCRLMPSESDLFAYLRSRGFAGLALSRSCCWKAGGEEGVELWKHGERWGYAATTRIGALVAAVVAVQGR